MAETIKRNPRFDVTVQGPARMRELHELGKIFGFKIPIDGHLSALTRKMQVDSIRLDEHFSRFDLNYNHKKCTYKGQPNVSMKMYVMLRWGAAVCDRLEKISLIK
jgi:hypothetical protein